jgi:hypothetical protein
MGLLKWVVAAAAGVVGYRYFQSNKAGQAGDAAAFAPGQVDPENFAQVRGAGPEAMRDNTKRAWTKVDQNSDESFPASDPPGSY